MVYISSSGEVLDKEPVTWKTPLKMLWTALSFIIEFFLSLFGMELYWRNSKVNRYFMSSLGYRPDSGDDDGQGGSGPGFFGGGGGGGGPGGPSGRGGGGGGGLNRRIHTLPRSGGPGVPSCAGGSCGR